MPYCAGDYNHALELDTRKKGPHVHSSRRFNSAQSSPTRPGALSSKAAVTDSGEDIKQSDCKVHDSQSSQDDLIKATHGQKEHIQTPNDSFLRTSACCSTESNGSRLAPDRAYATEAAIEVLKPCKNAQSTDFALDSSSQQGHTDSRSVPSADDGMAQLIAQHLVAGYSNRKKVWCRMIAVHLLKPSIMWWPRADTIYSA